MSRLEVITGPMFSGKSQELIRRLDRLSIAGKDIRCFKPQTDIRYHLDDVITHNGYKRPGIAVSSSYDLYEKLFNRFYPSSDTVIGIDEAQFFDDGLIETIEHFLRLHMKVIIAGLDKDFATQDFGSVPRLMILADKVDKLTAVCNKCGADDASFTQRLVDGKPAAFDGPTILVGGTESYEARCRDHFESG